MTTVRPEFDPHGRNGAGAHGYTATTATGIERWAPDLDTAIRIAEAQEAAYRDAGILDDVIARLA